MSFSFHPEADDEFIDAVAYYEDCEIGLGLDLSREVYAAIRNAVDYPTVWPEIEDEIRRDNLAADKESANHGPLIELAYASSAKRPCGAHPFRGWMQRLTSPAGVPVYGDSGDDGADIRSAMKAVPPHPIPTWCVRRLPDENYELRTPMVSDIMAP